MDTGVSLGAAFDAGEPCQAHQSKSGRRSSIPKMLLQGDVLACCQGVVVVEKEAPTVR